MTDILQDADTCYLLQNEWMALEEDDNPLVLWQKVARGKKTQFNKTSLWGTLL